LIQDDRAAARSRWASEYEGWTSSTSRTSPNWATVALKGRGVVGLRRMREVGVFGVVGISTESAKQHSIYYI
jgi:hypothetical protein